MRRKPMVLTLIVVALIGLVAMGGADPPARAQDATPVSEPVWEVLGAAAAPSIAPGATMELARFTWMPGYAQRPHTHHGADVVHVLSGEVAWSVANGEARVTRATTAGTPGPTETVPSGTETVLGPGDAIVFDYGSGTLVHWGRTVGNAPVVMMVASLYDPTKPITVFVDAQGTPIP